jgi:hypothetical protein
MKIKLVGLVAGMEEVRRVKKIFVGQPDGNR